MSPLNPTRSRLCNCSPSIMASPVEVSLRSERWSACVCNLGKKVSIPLFQMRRCPLKAFSTRNMTLMIRAFKSIVTDTLLCAKFWIQRQLEGKFALGGLFVLMMDLKKPLRFVKGHFADGNVETDHGLWHYQNVVDPDLSK